MSANHFRDRDVNAMIRLGRAFEPLKVAWLEELARWEHPEQLKAVTDAIETPTCSGSDIYPKEYFAQLCDMGALDIVHPDLVTAGGMLETKKIGDYAESKGLAMASHFAGTPVSFLANVHCAAPPHAISRWNFTMTTSRPGRAWCAPSEVSL